MQKRIDWTKEEIKTLVETNDVMLFKSILKIFSLQTDAEQNMDSTIKRNNIGFNHADARLLSYYAKWIKKTRRLDGKHIVQARKKMIKYSGQLAKIANGEL